MVEFSTDFSDPNLISCHAKQRPVDIGVRLPKIGLKELRRIA